jgi:transcriptional regulator with GAF, ATPase, and Fis domain
MAATFVQPTTRSRVQPITRPRVGTLIASPDHQFRRRWLLESGEANRPNHEVEGGAHALAKLSECDCDRVVLDSQLPDLDAGEVAGLIRQRYPRTTIQVVDSRKDAPCKNEVIAFESSQTDFAEKIGETNFAEGFQIDEQTTAELHAEPLPGMIGCSRAMREMYRMVRLVAPRDTAVLLAGETGTGKELVARAIHELSSRAKHAFVAVNCAAIPEALLESELFGHVRGAFTGAVQSRLGRIHMAHGGTLFLDEIGDLPLGMQGKLLRFLQNGEVQRLGSSDVYRVDVRVVCATNVRLAERILARQFRQDLYFRLAVFPVTLPPLRQRLGDIEPLAEHFLEQLSKKADVERRKLSSEALNVLLARKWQGNVRELEHALERAFILSGSSPVLQAANCQELIETDLSGV